jgi:predicted nucleotidyltransferase
MASAPPSTAAFDTSKLRARWARERAERAAASERLRARVQDTVPSIVARYGATAAYLFGSIADGRVHARSDVDLLVLGVGPTAYWALRRDLEQALGRPLDLYTQDDDPIFVGKAIARGERIYARKPGAADRRHP